jgi:hypothetical protein
MSFDPTKPVQTRDGCKARIICTDVIGKYPIIALITNKDGIYETSHSFTAEGKIYLNETHPFDLVNIPKRHKHYDVIIAFANGAEIEFKHPESGNWIPATLPAFHNEYDYRVKP